MKSNYKRLGDYIQLVDVANTTVALTEIMGVNIDKLFMPTVANTSALDKSKYRIVAHKQFACNLMHVGRDERIPIAINLSEQAILVSPAYKVFKVIDAEELDPQYLMLLFRCTEMDRKGWFKTDGDVRQGLKWESLCDILIPLPSISRQRELAAIYTSILNLINAYEKSIPRLQKICEDYIIQAKGTERMMELGEYIKLVDERNCESKYKNVLGINIFKKFIHTTANINSVNIEKYKIIKKADFAYSSMQVGRDKCIRVAMYDNKSKAIISPAYDVFRVKDETILSPEFLMMWCLHPETDRLGWFKSDGSVRSSLTIDTFSTMLIPLPSLEKQHSIVAIYKAMQVQKQILQQLKDKLTTLCPVLAKGAEIE